MECWTKETRVQAPDHQGRRRRRGRVRLRCIPRPQPRGGGPWRPATRERVIKVIEELGYRPRAAARDLSVGRTQALGLCSG